MKTYHLLFKACLRVLFTFAFFLSAEKLVYSQVKVWEGTITIPT